MQTNFMVFEHSNTLVVETTTDGAALALVCHRSACAHYTSPLVKQNLENETRLMRDNNDDFRGPSSTWRKSHMKKVWNALMCVALPEKTAHD